MSHSHSGIKRIEDVQQTPMAEDSPHELECEVHCYVDASDRKSAVGLLGVAEIVVAVGRVHPLDVFTQHVDVAALAPIHLTVDGSEQMLGRRRATVDLLSAQEGQRDGYLGALPLGLSERRGVLVLLPATGAVEHCTRQRLDEPPMPSAYQGGVSVHGTWSGAGS